MLDIFDVLNSKYNEQEEFSLVYRSANITFS